MKKLLLVLLSPLCFGAAATAQIVYHDIIPDTTISNWDAFTPCFMGQAHTTTGKYIDIWFHPTPEVVVNPSNVEILYDAAGTYPAKLKPDDSITPSGKWKAVAYDPLSSGGTGNWQTDATDKYLGFRFVENSLVYYGWLKLTVATGAASFTVKEWAYRPLRIKAGQTNTTSVQQVIDNNISLVMQNRQLHFNNLENGHAYTLAITGTDGRIIRTLIVHRNETINVSDIANGVYILRLTGDGRNASFKIAVQ